jgi:FkbM family methyltransferase
MSRIATMEIAGNVLVVVPDSLNLITPYILYEQGDWFEDEIKFLRCLIKPGQRVIDIGANYGVYALSMAKLVGPSGAVWAFEPTSSTAGFLEKGIAANNFSHVNLESCALSSVCGSAELMLNETSELNAISRGVPSANPTETVRVETLDSCMQRHSWRNISFVKIDAEGEEINIIKGATRFLSEASPLIMYEVRASDDFHLDLVNQFAALGYFSYRLLPGLDLLTPFDASSKPDGHLLNLFCCKADRAAELARDRLLVDDLAIDEFSAGNGIRTLLRDCGREHHWDQELTRLPYGEVLASRWRNAPPSSESDDVTEALACFAISHDAHLRPVERFCALEHSFNLLAALCESNPANLRYASLVRVAREIGARSFAVSTLRKLFDRVAKHNRVEVDEPFLALSERFDLVAPGANIGRWILASTMEELEKLHAYSSFFTGDSTRKRLEVIASLGFAGAEMGRRLELLRIRYPEDGDPTA